MNEEMQPEQSTGPYVTMEESREKGINVARLIDEHKGENINVLDVDTVCNFTSVFVVASANSSPQLRALAGRVQRKMREWGHRPIGVSGSGTTSWVVLDFADIVVHLFNVEAREYYRLEELWKDATPIIWEDPSAPKKDKVAEEGENVESD